MSTPNIPLISLRAWRDGDPAARRQIVEQVDQALQDSGFLLLGDHNVPAEAFSDLRASAKAFFALPAETKAKYATYVGGRGWIPIGKEANSFFGEEADASRPDMKESYTMGRPHETGDATIDEQWFKPNVWPEEVPELEKRAVTCMESLYGVYDDLLRICGDALGLGTDWFIVRSADGTRTMNINRYPPLAETGVPQEGQYRVGPHTDWSIFTLLDRQVGYGGLQVETNDGAWVDAPHVDGALVINIGDLLARWTGDRWKSTRHRVLPPQDNAPAEELISIIQFCDANVDTIVEPMPAPIGHNGDYPPVEAGEYLHGRALAAMAN